jgi:hypothetical protein
VKRIMSCVIQRWEWWFVGGWHVGLQAFLQQREDAVDVSRSARRVRRAL